MVLLNIHLHPLWTRDQLMMTLLQLEQLKAPVQALLLCINKYIQNKRCLHKQVAIKALIIMNIWSTIFQNCIQRKVRIVISQPLCSNAKDDAIFRIKIYFRFLFLMGVLRCSRQTTMIACLLQNLSHLFLRQSLSGYQFLL